MSQVTLQAGSARCHRVARQACAALVLAVCLPAAAHAGLTPTARKNCNVFPKFKLHATMTYTNGFHQSVFLCGGDCTDQGCSFAEIHPKWIDNQTGVTLVSVDCRIGSLPHFCSVNTLNSHYHAGEAYLGPSAITPDSLGVARCSLTADAVVADSAGGTLVTLTGFTGALAAKHLTDFGSALRCVVWNSASAADTVIRPGNVLADGSVRIEHGIVATTGIFSGSDFVVDTVVDSTGYTVLRVRPTAGLAKHIFVPVDDAGNTVAISSFNEVGFGDYDPNFIYNEDETGFATSLPGLSPIGQLLTGAVLLLAGVLAIRRRRDGMTA